MEDAASHRGGCSVLHPGRSSVKANPIRSLIPGPPEVVLVWPWCGLRRTLGNVFPANRLVVSFGPKLQSLCGVAARRSVGSITAPSARLKRRPQPSAAAFKSDHRPANTFGQLHTYGGSDWAERAG